MTTTPDDSSLPETLATVESSQGSSVDTPSSPAGNPDLSPAPTAGTSTAEEEPCSTGDDLSKPNPESTAQEADGEKPDATRKRSRSPSTSSQSRDREGTCDSDVSKSSQHSTASAKRRKTEEDEKRARDRKMAELENSCNEHEGNLLRKLVRPENMAVTYDQVHVHPSTKLALQNLTLSLQVPHEFTYGVLAPSMSSSQGLLLYGPPGTGKTHLIKALAKECGANMLEVTSADIKHCYVGETEKNIQALFSLARKLSPCIVFLDEGDCLLGKRNDSQKSWERSQISQFLREWDGLGNDSRSNPTIVVSTNRPFDLDDAVLRRLPRRLLISMPEVQDRKEILKIHLASEQLGEDVDLMQLANQTPFYTGSDLKNLIIEAAIRCVREGMTHPSPDNPPSPMQTPPPRRTLRMSHFEHAKNLVRPANSHDGLKNIREFHAKFGNTAIL
ncbi:P-loop containing nucleoside triphosphate hydrolase protein [Cladorrhinum sp. PSN332]|nr:P-loop containing nucleoside triphosphate hydrolase protein [Cladorrhinum sp. PSN332]